MSYTPRRFRRRFLWLLLVVTSCASVPKRPISPGSTSPGIEGTKKSTNPIELERIQVKQLRDGTVVATDAMGLFEAGGHHMAAEDYRRALTQYDKLITDFPKSRLVPLARYNAGLAHEHLGEFDRAAARYRQFVDGRKTAKTPTHDKDLVDAEFRLGGCYAEMGAWKRSAAVFSELLGLLHSLEDGERVEAYARLALAQFRQDDHIAAAQTIRAGIKFLKEVDPFERLENDFFAGMLYFYFGGIPHARFRATSIETQSQEQLERRLDEKARLLLVAQRRYIQTIRTKQPYWATVAGFQIGSLYRELYDTLMAALPDFEPIAKKNAQIAKISVEQARNQLAETYLQSLHKRIRPLLEKAIRVFEKNVVVAARFGIDSHWIAKSRAQISELKRLLTADPAQIVDLTKKKPVMPEDSQGEAVPTAPAQIDKRIMRTVM